MGIVIGVLVFAVVFVLWCFGSLMKNSGQDDKEGTTTNNNNTNNRRKPILSIPTEEYFLMSVQHTKIDESYSQVHPQSGMYAGLYEQNSQQSSLSPFQLYFTQQYQENDSRKPTNTCNITGEGADTVGSYTMTGKTCGNNVSITKHYVPNTGDPMENLGHKVHLRLTKEGSTLTGKYYIKTHKWQGSGVYQIWLREDTTTTTVTANAVAMPLEPIMAEAHVLPVAVVAEANKVCSAKLLDASSSPTPGTAPPDTAAAPTFFDEDAAAADATTTVGLLNTTAIEVVTPQGTDVVVTRSEQQIQFLKIRRNGNYFVACKPSLDSLGEGSFWKVTNDKANEGGIFLGIIGNLEIQNNHSRGDPTSNGWAYDSVIVGGDAIQQDSGWTGFSRGECLYFHFGANKLTMFSVQKNRKFTIDITTPDDAYYMHFVLYLSGDKLKLEPLHGDEHAKLL